jgi:hypothetical protein
MGETPPEFYDNSDVAFLHFRLKPDTPWRHDLSADPGAKTEGGRHDAALSFPFGIGTKAANRPRLILCALYLISQSRFLHFTLNHYTTISTTWPT